MPDSTAVFQRAYRAMLIVYFAMFVSIFLVIGVAIAVAKVTDKAPDRILVIVLAFMAAVTLAVSATIRQKLLDSAETQLRINPDDRAAAGKWNQGVILGAAGCEAVALYGMVLALLGVPKSICGAFWVVAIVAMLFLRPKMVESAAFESGPISRS